MLLLDYKTLLDNLDIPTLITVPKTINDNISLYEIIFASKSFYKYFPENIKEKEYISDFPNVNNLTWKEILNNAFITKKIIQESFYSSTLNKFVTLVFKYVEEGFILVTIKDNQITSEEFIDAATELPNRNCFIKDIDSILINTEVLTAFFLIDIDDLKTINSTKGYIEGDKTILKAANILKRFSKENIKVYKYGDDEFMLVIKEFYSIDSLATITDTIFECFDNEGINISGGISIYPIHSRAKEDLLKFTDTAINYAKKNGKHQFVTFKQEMQKAFIRKMNLQNKMTEAVLSSSFSLYYQPQFSIETSELRGFEALIRWNDKELGNISPSIFIPLAEETGLIIPISLWVINTAFSTLKKWQIKYDFKGIMSINISPIQLKQKDFIQQLTQLIDRYSIEPSTIEIEITEGIMIENMDDAVEKLTQIKNMGIRVSLDDFGTGYSSLNYLQKLPLNTLKIDKSFIQNITSKDGIQANITNSIINMVSKMGLDTIAEGVESVKQLNILKKFNCNIIQGFLKGKPMPESNCNLYLQGDHQALLTM